jgi:hypothetical protein
VYSEANPMTTNGVPVVFAFGDLLMLYSDGIMYRSTNGTAYTSELDIYGTYSDDEPIGKPVLFGGSMFVPSYAGLLKRTSGASGVWSRPVTNGSNSRMAGLLNLR